jgi:hypothetical protein
MKYEGVVEKEFVAMEMDDIWGLWKWMKYEVMWSFVWWPQVDSRNHFLSHKNKSLAFPQRNPRSQCRIQELKEENKNERT